MKDRVNLDKLENFSTRVRKHLAVVGINTLDDLCRTDSKELRRIGLGSKSLQGVLQAKAYELGFRRGLREGYHRIHEHAAEQLNVLMLES